MVEKEYYLQEMVVEEQDLLQEMAVLMVTGEQHYLLEMTKGPLCCLLEKVGTQYYLLEMVGKQNYHREVNAVQDCFEAELMEIMGLFYRLR